MLIKPIEKLTEINTMSQKNESIFHIFDQIKALSSLHGASFEITFIQVPPTHFPGKLLFQEYILFLRPLILNLILFQQNDICNKWEKISK